MKKEKRTRIELHPRDVRSEMLDWVKTQITIDNDRNAIISQDELVVRLLAHFDQDWRDYSQIEFAQNLIGHACKELRDEIEDDHDDPWRVRANGITVIGSANTLLSHKAYRPYAEKQCIIKPEKLAQAFQDIATAMKGVARDIDEDPAQSVA